MNKAKDTGYLFAKMSPTDENGIGNIVVGEQKDKKGQIPPTRTYHFDEGGQSKEKQSIRKWIRENIMLVTTLTAVLIGLVSGTTVNKIFRLRKIKIENHCQCDSIVTSNEFLTLKKALDN